MVTIIGAGPAGLVCARALAKRGIPVEVFEEHKQIGEPVQCTGIVTSDLEKIIHIKKDLILNRIKTARIYSKHRQIELPVDDIILDRTGFDRYLAGEALKAGAVIHTGKKIDKLPKGTVVGADGPYSMIGKILNPELKSKYYIGKQAIVRGSFKPDVFEIYLGSIAPHFFAWVVPESRTKARIGLASRKNTERHFGIFLKTRGIKDIESMQAGLIPVYDQKKATQKDNLYLIGDAAAQVKATTGGGLVPGIKAALICAESIRNKTNYHKAWKKSLGKELMTHLLIRNTLDRFSDNDFDALLQKLSDKKITKIFKKLRLLIGQEI